MRKREPRQAETYHVLFPDFQAWQDETDNPPPEHRRANRKDQLARLAGQRSGTGPQTPPPPEIALGLEITAAQDALRALRAEAAAGNQQAAEAVLGIIRELVAWLERFAHRRESLLKPLARQAAEWPMLVSLHPVRQQAIRDTLKRLELGADSGLSTGTQWGKGWGSGWSVATKYALCMVQTLEANQRQLVEYERRAKEFPAWRADWRKHRQNWPAWARKCRTLPALSKATAAQWFKIGWEAILEKFNGHPEDVPELRTLGAHREKHSEHTGQQKRTTSRTAAVNIRARIKERLAQAVESLAPSR